MRQEYLTGLGWLEKAPADFRRQLQDCREQGAPTWQSVRRLAAYGLSEPQLASLGKAVFSARTASQESGLTSFRLAILSNATTEHLTLTLTASALRHGIDLHVRGFSYDDAYAVAVDGRARLAALALDGVLIAFDHRAFHLPTGFGDEEEEQAVASGQAYLQALLDGIRRQTSAVCLLQTMACPPLATFGHADRKLAASRRRIIDRLNQFFAVQDGVLIDVATLAEQVGTVQWFDDTLFCTSKIPFALTFLALYGDHVCRVIGALRGKSRRVLAMDLDNTLWGGVVGDDGVEGLQIGNGSPVGEAFLAFQKLALSLRARGILLAVCSKNDDAQARRPFREIPGMILKEDSFTAFHANWDNKADNIEAIARALHLGLDAVVFVDDNPVERALVRRFLPDVAVPELPPDPSDYAFALASAGYFEAFAVSDEDRRRADLYRGRSEIAALAPRDLTDYLASLDMTLTVDRVNDANRTRVVQLINKSNQFNLTTLRLTQADVVAMERDGRFRLYAARLRDRYDDHGVVSVITVEQTDEAWLITLWVMSCRVIGRGVEASLLTFLRREAAAAGVSCLEGRYIPTARNAMVEGHYPGLGFTLKRQDGGVTDWTLLASKDVTPVSGIRFG